jgi:hypothetical protein
MHDDEFRNTDEEETEDDAPFKTDDEGDAVEPEDDGEDFEKHGFSTEEEETM